LSKDDESQSPKDMLIPYFDWEFFHCSLNNLGMVSTWIDDCAREFINYAGAQTGPVLELGAGYGAVAIEALKAGGTVIVNDLEMRHLEIIYNKTPVELKAHLTLMPGFFPEVFTMPHDSLHGCFTSRMLGHLTPVQLRDGLKRLFDSLIVNAKFFIVLGTLHTRTFKYLIPQYEKRVLQGDEWPGYFTGLKKYARYITRPYIPDILNFLDERVLKRELEAAGFVVLKAYSFERTDIPKPLRYDGREGFAVIAQKPEHS
jgi:SAM-dependent methyltransferase